MSQLTPDRFEQANIPTVGQAGPRSWLVLPLELAGRPPRPPRRFWFLLGALLLAGIVILAHGCHGSDHDDEPAWFVLDPSRHH